MKQKTKPFEVWLSQRNIQIHCMIVNDDETTEQLDVDSLSMRGAQREMTGWLLSQGYKPVGRWEAQEVSKEGGDIETMRQFKPADTKPSTLSRSMSEAMGRMLDPREFNSQESGPGPFTPQTNGPGY